MKKAKRIWALVLTVILCVSLCGCQDLDDMKARQATWMENGHILWNGYEYLPLSESAYGMYYNYTDDLNWDDSEMVYITEADVPVLLSEEFGRRGYSGADGLLIEVNVYVNDEHINNVYCRADMYDWTLNALQNGYEIQEYGYYYFDYMEGESHTGNLTEAQRQAVDDVLNNVRPITAEEDFYPHYDYEQSLTISAYSMAHLFSKGIGELCYINGTYSIVDSYYDEEGLCYSNYYVVPDKYTDLFNELFDKAGVKRNEDFPETETTLGKIV